MDNFIPICYKYILRNINLEDEKKVSIFQKNFIHKLREMSLSDDDIASLLITFPNSVLKKAPTVDLSEYEGNSLFNNTTLESLFYNNNISVLSCDRYLKSCIKERELCKLCPFSKSYINSTRTMEHALLGYLFRSKEDYDKILSFIQDCVSQLFVSYEDIFDNIFASKPLLYNINLLVAEAVITLKGEIFNTSNRSVQISNHIWANGLESFLKENGIEFFTKKSCDKLTNILLETYRAESKNHSINDVLKYVETKIPQLSFSFNSEDNSEEPAALQSPSIDTTSGTEVTATEENKADNSKEKLQIDTSANTSLDAVSIDDEDAITSADEVLEPEEITELKIYIPSKEDHIFHLYLSNKEINEKKELDTDVISLMISEKGVYVETAYDNKNNSILLFYSLSKEEIYYTYLKDKNIVQSLMPLFSNSSIPIITYQPYRLYSVLRKNNMVLRSLVSIYTFYQEKTGKLPTNYKHAISYFTTDNETSMDIDLVRRYPEVYLSWLKWIKQNPDAMEVFREAENHYEAFGTNYLLNQSLISQLPLFTMDGSGALCFNENIYKPYKNGYFITFGIENEPDDCKTLLSVFMRQISEIGGWKNNQDVYLIAVTPTYFTFYVRDKDREKDIFLDYSVRQFFKYGKSKLFSKDNTKIDTVIERSQEHEYK